MQKIHLKKIYLSNYRNFTSFHQDFTKDLVLITGNNGVGKTNILEAISYLSPGMGIRSAKLEHIARDNIHGWSYEVEMQSRVGLANITCGYDLAARKRSNTYNGSKIASAELSTLANIIWLTPQMSDLFIGSRSNRLRFFDRMVFAFFPEHARNLNKIDYLQRERLGHLTKNVGKFDQAWLHVLEKQLVELAQKVSLDRVQTKEYMQMAIDKLDSEFPKAMLHLKLDIPTSSDRNAYKDHEAYKGHEKDREVQENNLIALLAKEESHFVDRYMRELFVSRNKDAFSGRTNFGVSRTDFNVVHRDKKQDAGICSTGEQKAMLISLFLAQIEAIIEKHEATPILLLDELFVHLDHLRKQYLSEYVISKAAQTFITATDFDGIEKIAANAQRIEI